MIANKSLSVNDRDRQFLCRKSPTYKIYVNIYAALIVHYLNIETFYKIRDASTVMIRTLVNSALKTGCLSVESEGLMRQVLKMKAYRSSDLDELGKLYRAVKAGAIQREASGILQMPLPIALSSQLSAVSLR